MYSTWLTRTRRFSASGVAPQSASSLQASSFGTRAPSGTTRPDRGRWLACRGCSGPMHPHDHPNTSFLGPGMCPKIAGLAVRKREATAQTDTQRHAPTLSWQRGSCGSVARTMIESTEHRCCGQPTARWTWEWSRSSEALSTRSLQKPDDVSPDVLLYGIGFRLGEERIAIAAAISPTGSIKSRRFPEYCNRENREGTLKRAQHDRGRDRGRGRDRDRRSCRSKTDLPLVLRRAIIPGLDLEPSGTVPPSPEQKRGGISTSV